MVMVLWGFSNFFSLSPVNFPFTNERQSALRLVVGGGVVMEEGFSKTCFIESFF
jgi:hypothetical protein